MHCHKLLWPATIAVAMLTALAAGCDSKNRGPTLVPVTGTVLLDGEPLKFGSVTFQPAQGQPARGTIAADGSFSLSTYEKGDGAAVGRHKVRITSYSSQDPHGTFAPSGPAEALGESLIPPRYTHFDTSGLEVTVLEWGEEPLIFKLASDESQNDSPNSGAAHGFTTRPDNPDKKSASTAEDHQ